ncbi:spore germination protein GerPE [Metabacillus sp. GX 13764]|uniref:spore germination protein GerPE n=1 Tax=Metabacillus kandeliae TaxID=2900151 RepID=UPI001E5E8A62|nr:spore germination protein GerPE [Metabacillus kandeliae]MCD7034897.1 spore germination protein GerPE [Metabacillus kandeliae]
MRRLSVVKTAYVNVVGIASVFNIGDSSKITPRTRVFAVQREAEIFFDGEGDLNQFEIFSLPLPVPVRSEFVRTCIINENAAINAQYVKILGVSTASIFHIGSTNFIDAEARIKHTRQLLQVDEP